jgi:hypothetical protein
VSFVTHSAETTNNKLLDFVSTNFVSSRVSFVGTGMVKADVFHTPKVIDTDIVFYKTNLQVCSCLSQIF